MVRRLGYSAARTIGGDIDANTLLAGASRGGWRSPFRLDVRGHIFGVGYFTIASGVATWPLDLLWGQKIRMGDVDAKRPILGAEPYSGSDTNATYSSMMATSGAAFTHPATATVVHSTSRVLADDRHVIANCGLDTWVDNREVVTTEITWMPVGYRSP